MPSEDLNARIRAALRDVGVRPDVFTNSDVQTGAVVALIQFACAVAVGLHVAQPESAEHIRKMLEAAELPLGKTTDRDRAASAARDVLLAVFRGCLRGENALK